MLKIELATAIVGISPIHLLKTFIETRGWACCRIAAPPRRLAAAWSMPAQDPASKLKTCGTVTASGVLWKTILHTLFIQPAIPIAWTDKLTQVGGHGAKVAHAASRPCVTTRWRRGGAYMG